ncbi:MAG: hypothetical protein IIV72_08725, partial [Alistipes sp.]|nr:hypothetical protein [Alistipes sp.]
RTGATFEGCEFNGGENYVVAINYFQEAANKVMNVNNCAFTQTYIYSKVKCHLSNNTFELNECPYPICVWPCPAGSTNNECTFVNNTVNSNNPSYRPLVMLLTQSTPFANVVFNVQGNSGNYMYAYGWVTKARCATDGSVTFAEGSSKFTINADGTLK